MSAHRKPAIARAFDRAAQDYDAHAIVQRATAARLGELIAELPPPPAPRLLEIGCGTGFLSTELVRCFPSFELILTDISEAMVRRTRAAVGEPGNVRYLVMDGERPTVQPDAPFGLICSSLAFQWFEDLGAAMARLGDLLAPGGHLAFATLAAGTFAEWRAAHGRCGLPAATRDYPAVPEITALCPPAMEVRIESQTLVDRHDDGRSFLRSLKAIGAHTPWDARPPLPAGTMRRVLQAFEEQGASATYEIAHVMLRKTPEGL
jgi:malonyl-CoA O-methyltransferase